MLHTNLNTWHAQESRKTERGGGRGKTWKILPTLTHTIASRMRCCYPFPLLAAAQKPLESLPPGCVPCLWLPLTLPPTLSLYLHLTPSYIHLTSSEKPLLETKTSKNILPFLVVAKSLLFLCVGWFYVFGFERFCLLCICLAFSCTACRKEKKIGNSRKKCNTS